MKEGDKLLCIKDLIIYDDGEIYAHKGREYNIWLIKSYTLNDITYYKISIDQEHGVTDLITNEFISEKLNNHYLYIEDYFYHKDLSEICLSKKLLRLKKLNSI